MSTIEIWKKAVVHLECATDSEHIYDRIAREEQQRLLLQQGEITEEEYRVRWREINSGRSRDIRFQGTAVYLMHAKRRYLITARHVVWDKKSAERELQETLKRFDSPHPSSLQREIESANKTIFKMIFRVPSFEAPRSNGYTFLMNLGAGGDNAYTFSEPELDLAIISLDQRGSDFADNLNLNGFKPMPSDKIIDGPEIEGQEVSTIGFPSSTAILGMVNQNQSEAMWASKYYSLPVCSFGRVSMIHNNLPFFWADMSAYPGNSGGPVILDNNLAGIVSGQATIEIDGADAMRSRIPFTKVIKASHIRELLKIQEKKDDQYMRV